MKKAVIHIGAHKTGSTAVQILMFENAPALQQAGVTYPLQFARSAEKPWYGQHSIAFFLQNRDVAKDCCEDIGNMAADLQKLPRDTDLLLSSEVFSTLNAEQIERLKGLLEGFDVQVIFYVRRQEHAMQALYQTNVVHYKLSQDFETFFKANQKNFDYHAIATRWAEVFGQDAIHVRKYDRDSFKGGDVTSDFVSALGQCLGRDIDTANWTEPQQEVNRGLPAHVVFMLAFFNGRKNVAPVAGSVARLAYQLYPKGQGAYEVASPSMRKSIVQHYAESNARLAHEFMGQPAGTTLFEELPVTQTDAQWNRKFLLNGANLHQLAQDAANRIQQLSQGAAPAAAKTLEQPQKQADGRPDRSRYASLHKIAAAMPPEKWAEVVAESLDTPVTLQGVPMPSAPDPAIQVVFSNDSGQSAILRTAFPVYQYAIRHAREQGVTLNRFMDFGCGWGRITRLFLREVDEGGLYGVDPWDEAIQLCRMHMPFACFVKSEPDPPLLFADNTFDMVFSNSVFTHLSEESAMQWGQELTRILKPGGLLVATARPRRFFTIVEDLKAGTRPCRTAWDARMRDLDLGGRQMAELREKYEAGEFVFIDSHNAGEDAKYGLAFLPEGLIRKKWTGMSVVEYLADPPQGLLQAPFVLKKI